MTRRCEWWCVLFTLVVSSLNTAAYASSTGSFGGSSLGAPSPRLPNIIIIDVDDVGREMYPQLGAPWAADPSDTTFMNMTHTAIHGNKYPVRTASSFPNLDRLLAIGVNFQGMWGNGLCALGRETLRTGEHVPHSGNTLTGVAHSDHAPKRQIQDGTGEAYRVYHYGKDVIGCERHGGTGQNSCLSGTGGPVHHLSIGEMTNHPGFWWASQFKGRVNDEGDSLASYIQAAQDPGFYTAGGKPMQNQDEFGVEQMIAYVEGLYGGSMPQDFWSQQTGQPFIATLGLHYNHLGNQNACLERTASNRLKPNAQQIAYNGTADPTAGQGWNVFDTPTYGLADTTTLELDLPSGGMDWWPASYDCQMQQLEWVDEQLGMILDWLGPEGLKHTLLIFMGDNGTEDGNVAHRVNAKPPHLPTLGQGSGGGAPNAGVGDFILDETSLWGASSTSAPAAGFIGKGATTETGLNVAFVVAGGPVADFNEGTTSTARLQFADISETLVQVAVPGRVTGYAGRDFSGLFTGEPVPALGVTFSSPGGTGTRAEIPAVLQPDSEGRIFRLLRNYGPSDHCDYLQDLSASSYWVDLRDDPDPAVQAAWATLDAAITSHPDLSLANAPTLTAANLTEAQGALSCGPP